MENMFGLFRRHHGNGKDIWGALDPLKEANLKLNPKKCLLFQKEVEFLGHIVSVNGMRTTGPKIKHFAIGQDQEINTKSEVSWDCARTTEDLSTGLLILPFLCTGWRIWSLSLIGLLNVKQLLKDWRTHYALVLFCPILNHRECLSWTRTQPTLELVLYCHRCRTRKKKSSSTSATYFLNPRRTTVLRGRSC